MRHTKFLIGYEDKNMLTRTVLSDKILQAYVDYKNKDVKTPDQMYKASDDDIQASIVAAMYPEKTVRGASVMAGVYDRAKLKKK